MGFISFGEAFRIDERVSVARTVESRDQTAGEIVLEVFNAVSDSAGAEDQGMRSVPIKVSSNAAMRIQARRWRKSADSWVARRR